MDAGEPTIWSWIGFMALAAVLVVACYVVIRISRRLQARAEARASLAAELPPEYRLRPEPLWIRIGAVAVFLLTAVAARAAGLSEWGALGVLGIVTLPLYARFHSRQAAHRRQIIAAVERDFATMPAEDLERLVVALEIVHGVPEMRPLRRLLRSVQRSRVESLESQSAAPR